MKKIFDKKDHTAIWLGAAIAGALAAGAGIWFYLQGKRSAALDAEVTEHAQDYLQKKYKKKKKHKTDKHELENIVNHEHDQQ